MSKTIRDEKRRLLEKYQSLNDFLKNYWKNRHLLPRNQCRGTLELFESWIELWMHDDKRNQAKQGFADPEYG